MMILLTAALIQVRALCLVIAHLCGLSSTQETRLIDITRSKYSIFCHAVVGEESPCSPLLLFTQPRPWVIASDDNGLIVARSSACGGDGK
jgi:hypothetical protein